MQRTAPRPCPLARLSRQYRPPRLATAALAQAYELVLPPLRRALPSTSMTRQEGPPSGHSADRGVAC
jgi:hypothetical protein